MTILSIKQSARTITMEELFQIIENALPVQIVNVLSPEYYDLGFIKGSIKIPLDQLDNRWEELDKNIEVVTYSAIFDRPISGKAAEKLLTKGFRACAYEGGVQEWKEAGLPIE